MKKSFIIISAILLLCSLSSPGSPDWPVPGEYTGMNNPVTFNNPNVRAGKELWEKNCKSCHGDPGKFNAVALVPPPPDATSEAIQANTDGEIFYKITAGRGAMPQFELTLSTDDRWKIITYIRKFDPRNEGLLAEEVLRKGKIYALVGENNQFLDIVAEELGPEGASSNLANAPVQILARKAFGNLLVGTITTGTDGKARFTIPADMKTKSDGKVDFVLALGEEFEPVTFAVSGVQVRDPEPYIPAKSVLWSTNDRTQAWLLFTYFAALVLAWSTIGYIVLQIIKIKKLGKT